MGRVMATRRRGRKRSSASGHGVILLLPRTSVTENRKTAYRLPTYRAVGLSIRPGAITSNKSNELHLQRCQAPFPSRKASGYADESGEGWVYKERRPFQRVDTLEEIATKLRPTSSSSWRFSPALAASEDPTPKPAVLPFSFFIIFVLWQSTFDS